MKKFILFAAILFLANISTAFANSMPRSEMCIGGVGYGITLGHVKEMYGEPLNKETFTGDGVRGVTWVYDSYFSVTARTSARDTTPEENLTVVAFRLSYNFSPIGNPDLPKTPSGITVGMNYNDVVKLWGRGELIDYDGRTGYFYVPSDSDIPMTLTFYVNDADTITEIALGTDF